MKRFFPDFISFHPGSLAAKSLALNKNPVPDAAQRNPEICVNRDLIIYHLMIQ